MSEQKEIQIITAIDLLLHEETDIDILKIIMKGDKL